MDSRFERFTLRYRLLKHLPVPVVQHSFEMLVVTMGIVAGVPLIISPAVPGTIESVLPRWLVLVWATQLIFGCAIVAYGLMMHSIKVERFGLGILAPASVAYSIVILYALEWDGLLGSLPYLGFALACLLRRYVLGVSLRVQERVLRERVL